MTEFSIHMLCASTWTLLLPSYLAVFAIITKITHALKESGRVIQEFLAMVSVTLCCTLTVMMAYNH